MTDPNHALSDELEAASRAEVDQLKAQLRTVAEAAGYYFHELIRSKVPDDLARELVIEWHGYHLDGA